MLNNPDRDKWDKHYQSCSITDEKEFPIAAEVLLHNQHLLPESGTALDLACGLGANAICLAEQGLSTSAWDISASALDQLSNQTKKLNIEIAIESRDVSTNPPEENSFDVISVSRFLDRDLMPYIKNAVRENGQIFYQTFTKEKVSENGPSNPEYLLDKNELLNFFINWKILFYREEGTTGDIKRGFRNQAMLIAQKQ